MLGPNTTARCQRKYYTTYNQLHTNIMLDVQMNFHKLFTKHYRHITLKERKLFLPDKPDKAVQIKITMTSPLLNTYNLQLYRDPDGRPKYK